MAAITAGSSRTQSNGVATVTVVAAPGVGVFRCVLCVRGPNTDTVARTMTLKRNIGGTSTQLAKATGLAVDDVFTPVDRDHIVIITGTDVLEIVMDAKTTNDPYIHAEWIDKS